MPVGYVKLALILLVGMSFTVSTMATDNSSLPAADLSVMSFNIRCKTTEDSGARAWSFRKALASSVISQHGCDFVGLQEVRAEQYQFLSRDLEPLYDSVYLPRDENRDEGVPVFYLKERWTREKNGSFWLSSTPERKSSFSGHGYRIVTWVRLRRRANSETVLVLNTHYDYESAEARVKSTALILREIARLRNSPEEKVVLTGDLNAVPSSPEVRGVTATGLLHDSAEGMGLNEYATDQDWTGRLYGEKLDYVFTTRGLKALGFLIYRWAELLRGGSTQYPSDHYPVIATFAATIENDKKSATERRLRRRA